VNGVIFDIQRFSVHDGPGIRTTVFLKGCPLRCAWCHNPEGLSPAPQLQFTAAECIGCGRCGSRDSLGDAAHCPTGALKVRGEEISPEALLPTLLRDRSYYGTDGGVTFSGGECLAQADFVAELLSRLKAEGIHTAVDTSGYVGWEAFEKTLPYTNLYLYDVKLADDALHKQYTGVSNARILENLEKLSLRGARIWIRVPVIPDVNDSDAEMRTIAQIVGSLAGVEKVTLMPYHTLGISKYETLGLKPGYETPKSISKERLQELKALFLQRGITVD